MILLKFGANGLRWKCGTSKLALVSRSYISLTGVCQQELR
jgi:hypothetical protein